MFEHDLFGKPGPTFPDHALSIAEQNIGFLDIATRVFVIEGGRIRFSGTVAEMTDNAALRQAYFGLKSRPAWLNTKTRHALLRTRFERDG